MAERVDDLQYRGLKLIQDTEEYRFGVDAVELAAFADVKRGAAVADIGAGTGVLSVLLAAKKGARVTAVEINPATAALCRRSAELNGLDGQIATYCMRAQDAPAAFGRVFDAVVSNPPYFKVGSGALHARPAVANARHELTLTLAETADCAAALLKPGGALYVVYPADRLAEALAAFSVRGLEPKRLRFVASSTENAPSLALVEARRGGKAGLSIEPMLFIGSADWDEVYFRT